MNEEGLSKRMRMGGKLVRGGGFFFSFLCKWTDAYKSKNTGTLLQ